jgi:hypothetical protein
MRRSKTDWIIYKKCHKGLLTIVALLVFSGCVHVQRATMVDVRAPINPEDSERAYKIIAQAFLDKGFDIKTSDSDLRIITTEYKKYESEAVDGFYPFDFYLQVKAAVSEVPGLGSEISLWPKIKEQNRINSNATERPLIVYSTKELANIRDRTVRSEAMLKAQLLFESVVRAITDALGVAPGSFRPTMNTIEVSGM